jgi:hypothetical protein
MVRVSLKSSDLPERVLCVEGRLEGSWVEACREAAQQLVGGRPNGVDLSELTSADREGLKLLRCWMSKGTKVVGISCFIAELLDLAEETSCPN